MPKPASYTGTGPRAGSASFAVGISRYPYLADHGFQDMIVLPGALYVEMALCVHLECLHAPLGLVKHVVFLNPVILTEAEITLTVGIRPLSDQTVQYTFHEANEGVSSPPCARVEIETDAVRPPGESTGEFCVETFQQRADFHCEQADFYRRLSKNGNQYGPQFQCVRAIWRLDQEVLGRLRVPPNDAGTGDRHLHPIVMDGVTQLLSSFQLDQGRTFILQSFEEVRVLHSDLPEEVWVHGRLRPQERTHKDEWAGDLEVFNDSGECCLKFLGVRFTYRDQPESVEITAPLVTDVVIASTFTAEPVEDSLHFWGDYLGLPVRVSFAPYNQVFQQLLSPDSQLRRNQNGCNAILLNLGDWATAGHSVGPKLAPPKAAASFGTLARHILPNGLEVAHLNRHETEYVYKEIFEDRAYFRHGIHLPDGATVLDIGANIGLFSLFVRSHFPDASVYAFEPSPVAYQALKANCEAYGPRLAAFNVGVSEFRGSATLTAYERSSVFSSFHADAAEDRKAIRAVVANMVRNELGAAVESVDSDVDELITHRLDQRTFECPLLSVSDIIRDNSLPRVNLLKIDAEKCELEILRGIDESHWPLIDQVVIEVHDRTRRAVEEVQKILSNQGFRCAVEEENLLTGSGLFNVYATRENNGARSDSWTRAAEIFRTEAQGKVDQFIQALDAFTQVASAPTVLCVCPSGHKNPDGTTFDELLVEIESNLVRRVRNFPQVYVLGSAAILAYYPAADFHDPQADDTGHIPYTPDGFAAIGSSLFRVFTGLRRPPYKVIALDCDNTLWQGVCGEEGALGVVVTPAHRALQEFMIRQMNAGMLLCLSSKNNEADVCAVFEQNPGMVLKREHLVAWRINWSPKSANLRSLASELNLGLESFVFLDDNPVECAEVRTHCPAALTLQLPSDPENVASFLDHTWAFDHLHITAEDRHRTHEVQENAHREKYRERFSTLKDFIDGLQLEVTTFKPARNQLDRVSQLTLRTNQFNFTTVRRLENDIVRHLADEANHCLAVKVRDRFGDYGMVGLLFYRVEPDRYTVDTFLLSCRVLGRGVEYQVLAQLGREAQENGRKWVELLFRPTNKNQPAKEFIESIGSDFVQKQDDGTLFRFSSAKLAGIRYEPNASPVHDKSARKNDRAETGGPDSYRARGHTGLSEKFQRIASDQRGVKQLRAAIESARLHAAGFGETMDRDAAPATLEEKLLALWRKAIGNPQLGPNDNFFDAGGTSLKVVQALAAIRRELNLQLSVVSIFECPTVRLLCERLAPGKVAGNSAADAMARGARRKLRAQKPD